VRWAETQMVSSLACAVEWLRTDICLVSYSDIFYSSDPVRALMSEPADLAVAYDPDWLQIWKKRFDNPLDDAETFRVRPDGRITEIGRKPQTIDEIQGQYMGLLLFRPKGWSAMETLRNGLPQERRDKIDMTSALQLLIEAGFPLQGVPTQSNWGEVDSDEDLARQS
jgi:choline kinase